MSRKLTIAVILGLSWGIICGVFHYNDMMRIVGSISIGSVIYFYL